MNVEYIFDFVSEYPDLVFDGKFFDVQYSTLDDSLRSQQYDIYMGYFNDVKWFVQELGSLGDDARQMQKSQIIRNRISLEKLYGSIK